MGLLTPSILPNEFFGYLVQSRVAVKLTHWAQPDKTDATHAALDELYDALDDLIDSIIEKYQGVYGLVRIEVSKSVFSATPLAFVEGMYSYIQTNRKIFTDSFLQNIIDEICAAIAKTLYKLKFVRSSAS